MEEGKTFTKAFEHEVSTVIADPRPYLFGETVDSFSLLGDWIWGQDSASTVQKRGWQLILRAWEKAFSCLKYGGYLACMADSRFADLLGISLRLVGYELEDEMVWLHETESGTVLTPILLAQKPLKEKTIVDNVMQCGTGAMNIDGCRIKHNEEMKITKRIGRGNAQVLNSESCGFDNTKNVMASADPKGRYPANVLIDDRTAHLLDKQSGTTKSCKVKTPKVAYGGESHTKFISDDSGGASRFFFQTKGEEEEGVIPLTLMTYLIRLLNPPNGMVLDPFRNNMNFIFACEEERVRWVSHVVSVGD